MNKQHVCISSKPVRRLLDELGQNHDKEVLKWRDEIASHAREEAIVTTLIEAVSSVDCTDKTFLHQLRPNESMDRHDLVENTIDHVLKDYVKSHCTCFGEEPYDKLWNSILEIIVTGKSLQEAVLKIRNDIKGQTPRNYQIIGDNIDLDIRTKHMSVSRQNTSLHWFNMYAIRDIVNGNEADEVRPKLADVSFKKYLPDESDDTFLRNDFVPLWSRVLVTHIPDLEQLKKSAVWHIPHKYSHLMQTPSEQVRILSLKSRFILFKKEGEWFWCFSDTWCLVCYV